MRLDLAENKLDFDVAIPVFPQRPVVPTDKHNKYSLPQNVHALRAVSMGMFLLPINYSQSRFLFWFSSYVSVLHTKTSNLLK